MKDSPQAVSVGPATHEDADGVVALFEAADVPCFCQYNQFSGNNREWQMRCGGERDKNRDALIADLRSGRIDAFVARAGNNVVGWMRMESAVKLPKIYGGRLYKGLPCFDGPRENVCAVVCFLVDPDARRTGVARALLTSGVAWARGQGATAVEVFPRGAQDVTDEEQFRGPLSLYESQGFTQVHDFEPYPVLRLAL